MLPDKRAVKILFDTYWTSAGWQRDPKTSPEDYAYARSQGVMFDPLTVSHDEAVGRAIRARDAVTKSEVTSAFVASLGTRRVELRSVLGSYAVARHLGEHRFTPVPSGRYCAICGEGDRSTVDLNVLNFERLKWGGVRHVQPDYIGLDLSQLKQLEPVEPTAGDRAMLRAILDIARSMSPAARPGDLEKALATVIPSNSSERRALIGMLGYCGILIDPRKRDFREAYVPLLEREHTHSSKDDWPFPVRWWNGSLGVTENAVEDWFGDQI